MYMRLWIVLRFGGWLGFRLAIFLALFTVEKEPKHDLHDYDCLESSHDACLGNQNGGDKSQVIGEQCFSGIEKNWTALRIRHTPGIELVLSPCVDIYSKFRGRFFISTHTSKALDTISRLETRRIAKT